jgi:hypothetical protein
MRSNSGCMPCSGTSTVTQTPPGARSLALPPPTPVATWRFPSPGDPELRDIEKEIAGSIGEADAELTAATPRAVPSVENCGNCDVRHLCDAYWSTVVTDPLDLPDEARFDCQGTVGTANGPRSWWLHVNGSAQSKLLIQAPESGPELRPGQHVRILGLRIDADSESDSTVTLASMNARTEVFRLSPTPK